MVVMLIKQRMKIMFYYKTFLNLVFHFNIKFETICNLLL